MNMFLSIINMKSPDCSEVTNTIKYSIDGKYGWPVDNEYYYYNVMW